MFELAYMLYRIGTSVIHGERRLMKTSGKLCLFYSPSKGGLRNLAQNLLHDLSSYPPPRWTLSPPLVRVFLFIRIGFTRWGFWAFPVTGISFIVGRNIRARRGLFSLCTTKFFFLDLQSLIANLVHQLARVPSDSFVASHFYQHGASASYPLAGYLRDFHVQGYGAHLADER